VIVFVDGELSHLVHVEVRVCSGNDEVKLLVAEHGKPLRFHDFEKSFSEEFGLLFDLFVALEVCVAHYEVHFVLAKSIMKYFVTYTCF
jgi:hypothetical protein